MAYLIAVCTSRVPCLHIPRSVSAHLNKTTRKYGCADGFIPSNTPDCWFSKIQIPPNQISCLHNPQFPSAYPEDFSPIASCADSLNRMLRVNEKSRLCIVGIASIVVFRPVEGDYGDRGNIEYITDDFDRASGARERSAQSVKPPHDLEISTSRFCFFCIIRNRALTNGAQIPPNKSFWNKNIHHSRQTAPMTSRS